jgi:hypothetical protein
MTSTTFRSTTFRTEFTISGGNAHDQLNEVARILQAIADQLDYGHDSYAGVAQVVQTVHDINGQVAGGWSLT